MRSDVGGNIDRLKARQATDPDKFAMVFDIVLAEVAAGQQDGSSSATKGLLWLKRHVAAFVTASCPNSSSACHAAHLSRSWHEQRQLLALAVNDHATRIHTHENSSIIGRSALCRAMEFVVAMLQRLHDDQQMPLPQAASDAYYATLHQYHGWITSAAFTVALKVSSLPSVCARSHERHSA